ncbi:MAG: hypothetical protein KIS92_13320 [Planctomycetota bacterium]|nr:hypothetical protein [Planctomycetota bacterium]
MKTTIALLSLLCACASLRAGETLQAAKIEPELAPDTELLARIEALPENTWMKLPPFKVIGNLDWLGPRADERARGPFGRSYCAKMLYAPERKRAIFFGGGHNVRRINDVWEYDLASNTWNCLRGGDPWQKDTEEWFREFTMLKDGIVMTKTGGMVSVSHQWDQVAYDPERRLALWVNSMPRSVNYSIKLDQPDNVVAKAYGLSFEEFSKKLGKDSIHVWGYDLAKKEWTSIECLVSWKGPGNTTGGRSESGILKYMPDQKTLIFIGHATLVRDASTGEWKKVAGGPGTYGASAAYDVANKQIVAIAGRKTLTYTIGQKGWKTAIEEGPVAGNDAASALFFDPVSKHVLMHTLPAKDGDTQPPLWIYDPAKNAWFDPKPQGDVPPVVGERLLYIDEARNVLVYYNSRDVYVYRYKRAAK